MLQRLVLAIVAMCCSCVLSFSKRTLATSSRFGERQGTENSLLDAEDAATAAADAAELKSLMKDFKDAGEAVYATSQGHWRDAEQARTCSSWGLSGEWAESRQRKIYYGVILNDELELLEILLHEIYPAVDAIIIVESATTFNGFEKEMLYLKHEHMFEPYKDKIRRVEVDFKLEIPNMVKQFGYRWAWQAWEFEEWQRHSVLRGAQDIGDTDIFALGDVDEIVSREYMNAVAHCDPFPKLRQSGVAKQEDCETRKMYLFAFQWHFGCYKYQTHFHPDMTSGICLKKGGINPKHLRTGLEDSRHKMKVPECKRDGVWDGDGVRVVGKKKKRSGRTKWSAGISAAS